MVKGVCVRSGTDVWPMADALMDGDFLAMSFWINYCNVRQLRGGKDLAHHEADYSLYQFQGSYHDI